jgi:hypothetical protein
MISKMRFLTTLIILCSSVLANAADDFDLKVSNIDVLRDKNVQTELGITEGQRKTMNVYADKYTAANKAKVNEYQKAKKQMDKAFADFGMQQYVSLRTSVLKVLSANQIKRLRELTLQAAGPRALLDKAVADKVGIPTADYKKFYAAIKEGDAKIAKIKGEVSKKIQDKYKGQKAPTNQKENDALRAKFNADLATEMKKHEAEMKEVLKTSETKTSAIISKKYLDALKVLMGKQFVPPKPSAPKKLGK